MCARVGTSTCMQVCVVLRQVCVRAVIASRNYLARGKDLLRCAEQIARSPLSAREWPPRAASEMPREIEWLAIECQSVMTLAPVVRMPLLRPLSRCTSQISAAHQFPGVCARDGGHGIREGGVRIRTL